ncbi:MAG: rod shape-determining protein MreD [Armatimonadota bacterium]|nr:rod shape-determining protein MreD [Armatimonadota bacterium]MDR7533971.1 rod shape-determining protein MreD [Armatimonadota bacterium]MDR7536439.1 rod shape-determining protein MreD [Armatimonadota bacterium]
MRRPLLLGVLLALAAAIDGAWLSRLPLPAPPDVLLLLVVTTGVRQGVVQGALAGAVAGYLRDLVAGSPLGVYMLAYLVVGTAAGAVMASLDYDQPTGPVVTAVAATLLVTAVGTGILLLAGLGPAPWPQIGWQLTAGAAVNALLARPVDTLLRWAERAGRRSYPARALPFRGVR